MGIDKENHRFRALELEFRSRGKKLGKLAKNSASTIIKIV